MMRDYYKKMPGDRKDGWKLRNVPLFFTVVPFIMRTRLDSQNYYEETLDVEPMMDFLKAHKEDMPNISMMTIFVAAMVRMISQRPALNRFVVHNKLYAHNSITISIAIKRTMSDDGEETMIKPSFDPRDTLQDVQRRLDEAIAEAMNHEEGTGIDGVAGLLGKLPAWLFRFAVSMIHFLDNRGWLPEKLVQASPWHCSAMYTNVGSLGIGPIYHHLTELGTYSTFIAMGKRERHTVYDENGDAAVEKTSKRAARRFFSGTARRQGQRLFDGGMETRVAGSERGRPFFQGSLPTDEVENVENRREGAGFGAFMRGKATIDCGKLCEKWGKPLPNGWIYRM